MGPLAAGEGRKEIKGSVTIWRPWQLKPLELFQGVAFPTPSCQHVTQEYLLICMQSGRAFLQSRNTRINGPVVDGMLLVVEPGETWTCHSKDATFHSLFIDPTWLRQFGSELFQREQPLPHFPSEAFLDPSLSQAIRDLAARSLAPVPRLQQEEMLQHLLAPLLLSHAQDTRALPQLEWKHPAIKGAKAYLEAHYVEDVALQELAGVANMSPFHFSRLFRQAVGLPPHAYQTKLRLARAKTLLAQGREIGSVASETGFFDQSHFTQQFKRHYLVTPGSYRKTARFS